MQACRPAVFRRRSTQSADSDRVPETTAEHTSGAIFAKAKGFPGLSSKDPITGTGAVASRSRVAGIAGGDGLILPRKRPVTCLLRRGMRVASIELGRLPRRVCKMQASFTVISGPHRSQTFQIPRGKFILGRETDCHLVLDSNSVSRHHCVLLLDDYTLRIRDLASKNGTFVNRDQTRTGERILVNGDTVRVADLVIRVELEAGASTPDASLETQDVDTETIDHAGDAPAKPTVDQPTSADASKKAARDA
jgi:hypothetical protein